MAQSRLPDVLITGATGRVGALLRKAWSISSPLAFCPVWCARTDEGPSNWVFWDMGGDVLPELDPVPRAILHLARSAGMDPDGGRDIHMARQALRLARLHAIPLLIASSVAVYGSSAKFVAERAPPRPVTRNGKTKRQLELCLSAADKVAFLRIGNVVGADALIGARCEGLVLDRAQGSDRGPIRSWIGPRTLAEVLGDLLALAVSGNPLPRQLNIAQEPALAMADLADADQRHWRYSARMAEVGSIRVDCRLLQATLGRAVAPAAAAALVGEWRSLAAVCA